MTSPTMTSAKAAKLRPPSTSEVEEAVKKKKSESDAGVDMGIITRLQNRLGKALQHRTVKFFLKFVFNSLDFMS